MNIYRSACVIALTLSPLGCGLFGDNGELKTYQVNHHRLECSGVAMTLCLLVRESATEDFTFMYETPRGFEYEWGYLYAIEVEERELSEVPADASSISRTLREVISKERVEAGTAFDMILSAAESRVIQLSPNLYRFYNTANFECADTDCEGLAAAIADGARILYSFEHPAEPNDPLRLSDWKLCDAQLVGSQTCNEP
jgi:hypothetical protein